MKSTEEKNTFHFKYVFSFLPVQTGSSPLHCRSPWQRRIVVSSPLCMVNPGLQRTSSRAEKEGEGERRATPKFFPGGTGHGHVRPVHAEKSHKNWEHCFIIYHRFRHYCGLFLYVVMLFRCIMGFLALTWDHTAESTLAVAETLTFIATVFILLTLFWACLSSLITQYPLWTLFCCIHFKIGMHRNKK